MKFSANRFLCPVPFTIGCFFSFSPFALADLDSATTVLARTYAPALSINTTLGYGMKFWGDSATPLYGFVRPYVTGVASPSVIEGKVGVEIFPISILGVDIKRTVSRRFVETKGQDCDQVECLGDLNYTDVSFQNYLGYEKFFSSIRWTRTFYDSVSASTRPVYELGTAVLLAPGGETGNFLTVALGREVSLDSTFGNSENAVGVLIQHARMDRSGQQQEGQYLFVRSDLANFEPLEGFGAWDVTIGVGRFKSDLNVAEVSGIISITTTHRRALGFGR